MMHGIQFNPLLLLSYIIGAFPTAVLIGKALGVVDLTQHGSGNSGATNAGRILGWPFFIVVLLIDVFKAYATIAFCGFIQQQGYYALPLEVYALLLLIGNGYSYFLGFKGGKGIATMIGIILYFFPLEILLCMLLLWVIFFCLTRKAGIASVGCLSVFPFLIYRYTPIIHTHTLILTLFMSIFGLYRHRTNINNYIASFYRDTLPNK
jgi:glycerol-3-phosphate acyltransferase PlsY